MFSNLMKILATFSKLAFKDGQDARDSEDPLLLLKA